MAATSIEDNKDDIIDGQFILPDSVIVEFEADDEATEPQIKEAAARRERSRSSSSRARRRSGISASPPLCPQSRYLLWSCIRSDSEAEPSPVLNYRRDPPDSSSSASAAAGVYQVAPPWLGCSSGNAAAREAVALLKAKQKARSRLAEAHNTTTTTSTSKEHKDDDEKQQLTIPTTSNHRVPASPEAIKNRRRRRGKQVQVGVDNIDDEDKENDKDGGILQEEDDVNDTPTTVDEVVIEDNKVIIGQEEEDNTKTVKEDDEIKGTPLFDAFTIWYDPGCSNDTNHHPVGARDSEEYSRGLVRIGDVNSVEQFWQFWNSIDLMKLPKYSTLSVFKNGIQPAWEDERNQEGGRWVVKGLCRTDSKDYYSTCVLALLGNLFTAPQKMNGIVLSVRPRGNTIGLWNSVVDPELFEVIDWELRSIAPEDMQETVEVEYRDHRGAINHNMRKLGSNASHWRLCAGVAMEDNTTNGYVDQFYTLSDDVVVGSSTNDDNTMYVPYINYVPYTTLKPEEEATAEAYY